MKATTQTKQDNVIYTYIPITPEAFQSLMDQQNQVVTVNENICVKELTDDNFASIGSTDCLGDDNIVKAANKLPVYESANTEVPAVTTSCVDATEDVNKSSETPAQNNKLSTIGSKKLGRPKSNNSESFTCNECGETFDRNTSYRRHLDIHKNTKKYKCEQCFESYNVEDNFILHKAIHDKGQPTCPLCDRKFQRMASLKSHLLMHQVEETFSCKECLAEYEDEDEYNEHVSRHTEAKASKQENIPYICSYCNYLFEDPKEYKEHVSFHIKIRKLVLTSKRTRRHGNGNKEYAHKCDVCYKTFPKSCLLERHNRIHSGERPFACTKCNKAFAQKCTLQIHLFKHTGIKPFKCTLCPAEYFQKGNLRVHVERTHTAPPNGKLFKCTQCTCIFRKVASLNAHITKMHGGTKPADEMSLATLREQLIKLQQMSGDSDKIPKISADSVKNIKIFDQKTDANETFVRLADSSVDGALRRYLVKQRVNGNIKWFICSYCTKEFKKPSDLIRHIRVHTKEKPYQCTCCTHSFSLKSTLMSHMNTHFSRRTYECTHCSKLFSSPRTLNIHYRKHDKSVARQPIHYKCSTCNKVFNSMMKADLHMNLHSASNSLNEDLNNLQLLLKQPMLETADGLLPVPTSKSKIPSANSEEQKNRQHKCCVCNAAFIKPHHVKRHMLIHSGEKNFKCDICSKSFYTPYALKEHVQLHSNIKNFICKICNKRFSTNVLLKRHVVKHSTARPYVCPYCKKRFKTVTVCRKHLTNVHHRDINSEIQALIETGELPDEDKPLMTRVIDLSDSLSDNPFGLSNFQEPESTADASNTLPQIPSDVDSILNASKEKQVFKKPRSSSKKKLKKCKSIDTHCDTVEPVHAQESSASSTDNILNEASVSEFQDKLNQDFINQLIANAQIYIDKSGNCRISTGDGTSDKVEVASEDNPVAYSTIYISYDDLQSLNTNVYNSLLPQVKLEGNDPILMSAMNESQESNILFMDPTLTQSSEYQTDSQNFDVFNPIMFNANMSVNDLSLNEGNINVTLPAVTNLNERIGESEVQQILPTLDDAVVKAQLATESNRSLLIKNNANGAVDHSKLILSNENVSLNDSLIITLNNDDLKSSDLNYFPNITFNLNNNVNGVGVNNNSLMSVSENVVCPLCKSVCNDFQGHNCINVDFLAKETRKDDAKVLNFRKSPASELPSVDDQVDDAIITDFNDQLQTAQVEISSDMPAAFIRNEDYDKDFRCVNCGKYFCSEARVLKHMAMAHGSKKGNKNKKSAAPNSNTENDKKVENLCNFCNKIFKKPSDLKRHIRTHTGEKPFACDMCDKSFSLKSTLQSHMRTHNPGGKKDFTCVVCNTNYSCKASLRIHMLIHTGVRPYSCRSCPMKFRTSAHRKGHEANHVKETQIRRTTENKTKPLSAVKTVGNYVESILLKTKEGEQVEGIPDIIGEDLTENNVSADDQALVNDETLNITEPIPVDLLQQLQNSGFLLEDGSVDILTSSLMQLDNDVLQDKEVAVDNDGIILGENSSTAKEWPKTRDFECDVCHKRYLSKAVLRKHQKIHKQGFKCGKCGKQFQSDDLLTKHTKLHLGYRPFSCLLCANSFSEEGSLKTHMKRIHNS